MHILHTITGLNVGGAEIMLYRYLRQRVSRGERHTVLSLMTPGSVAPSIEALGFEVRTLGLLPGAISPVALWRLAREMGRARPDLVHGWMYHGNLAATLGAALSIPKPPVIWSIHHSLEDIRREGRLTQWVIRACSRLSRSPAAVEYCSHVSALQHEAIGFDPDRRIVIPNAVDTTECQALPSAHQRLAAICGAPSDRIFIGNVARSHPMKNQAALVRAVRELTVRGHNVHAVLVGVGQCNGEAAAAVRELGLHGRVTLLERRSDIPEIAAGLDLFVLCSAWGEAFSIAAGEAMACETPVVATDVGDSRWLVGDTGRIVPPRDDVALIDALEEMVTMTAEKRREMGRRARARVERNFSVERYSDSHTDLYRAVLAQRVATAS